MHKGKTMETILREGRKKLIIRRVSVCVTLIVAFCLLGWGTAAAVKEINQRMSQPEAPKQIQKDLNVSGSSRPESSKATESSKAPESSKIELKSSSAESTVSKQKKSAAPKGDFKDTVFIGDSRTEGLRNYDGLGDATYYAVKGLMVNTVFTKAAINLNGKRMTVMQALQHKKYNKVYVMLGVNELGWSSFGVFIEDYGKVIDAIKKSQPSATVYVQSILPVSAKKSQIDKIYNNNNINKYNRAIKKISAEKGVRYLEVNKGVSDSSGSLPVGASADGVHLNREYCKKWCEYIKTNT